MNVSNQKPQAFTARAAAILTTGEVASQAFNVNNTLDGFVQVAIDFTVGSLTNCTFKPQINDGRGWYDVTTPGNLVLTASGAKAFAINCKGMKQFRVTAQGSGTVTGSSATIVFSYQTAGGALG